MNRIRSRTLMCFAATLAITARFTDADAQTQFSQNLPAPSNCSFSQYDAAVVSSVTGRLDVFAVCTNGNLGHIWGDARGGVGSWSTENLGGVATSEPAAVSWGAGHVAVFVKGSDNTVWYQQWDNGSATGWQSLGVAMTWNPHAVSTAPGHIIVFYRWFGQLAYRELNGGVWGPHVNLGGGLGSSPVAASWGPGHVAVCWGDVGADGMWCRQRNGSAWGAEQQLGGKRFGAPDPIVVSRGPGLLDVFGSGQMVFGRYACPRCRVYKNSFNGSWSGWQNLGAPDNTTYPISEPGAVATTSGQLVAFVRGARTVSQGFGFKHIYGSLSNDGGITWNGWGLVMSQTDNASSNPEAAPNVYGGFNVVAVDAQGPHPTLGMYTVHY